MRCNHPWDRFGLNYINFVFHPRDDVGPQRARVVWIVTDGVQKPQHSFCSQVLGNGSMKPSILKAHFFSCHSAHLHNAHESLHAWRAQFRAGKILSSFGFTIENKSALEPFYQIARKIAKEIKPHTLGERLIKPCATDMV